VDENLDVKYHTANIKKDWGDSQFDNAMYKWMNTILFEPVVIKHTLPDMRLKTKIVYYINYEKYNENKLFYNYINDIKQMTRKDFANVYIINQSQVEKENTFNIKFIQSHLHKYGIKPIDLYSSLGVNPVFGWIQKYGVLDVKQYKLHYHTNFFIGSILDNHSSISNKNDLYFNFKNLFPNDYTQYFAKSKLLKANYIYNPNEILIAKPINLLKYLKNNIKVQSCGGDDILIINSNAKLTEAKNLLKKYDNILLSEYIQNPLLFKTRKFHLRIVFLATIVNNKFATYLLDTSTIILAKLPYKNADYHNKDIHDTHFKSTDADYFFPRDFTTENIGIVITPEITNKLLNDMRILMAKVSEIMFKKGICLFKNTKNGFHVFGGDIMITDDFKIILLEVNGLPGFGLLDKTNTVFDELISQMIDDNVLNPLLSSDDKTERKQKAEKDEKTINKKHINNNIPLFSASVL
jgi:hypothetical protein